MSASRQNRRSEPRWVADQTVQVTLLGPNEVNVVAQAVDVSPGGMRLLVGCPFAVGTAMRIDLGDMFLVGEVRYCHTNNDQFAIGLEMEHALRNLSDFARMMEAAMA